jgi:hypothetical protein
MRTWGFWLFRAASDLTPPCTGAAKIKVPTHLCLDARWIHQAEETAKLQSSHLSSTQGWDTVFDKILFVARGHDSKANATSGAWECIKDVFQSKRKPEGCKHPGEFGDAESFFQTELKDLFHAHADVMTLSHGGLRKQKVLFPESEVMLKEDRLQAAHTATWAHEVSKAILPQPTVKSLLSSQWVAKQEDCPDQMGHTDWPATSLPLEAACPDRPMYLSFLTPVTGRRTLSFWLASHIIVPVGQNQRTARERPCPCTTSVSMDQNTDNPLWTTAGERDIGEVGSI